MMLDDDFERAVHEGGSAFADLAEQRILMTGASGFVGAWLLGTLLHARAKPRRESVVILTRAPERFAQRFPRIAAHPDVTLHRGDIREALRIDGAVDLIVHGAAETNVDLSNPAPSAYFDVGLRGTLNIADFATHHNCGRILFLSSGAVYGAEAFASGPAVEDAGDAPPIANAPYGNAKRACEALLAALSDSAGPVCVSARMFAFLGPMLPLDSGFAAGNFLRDGAAGKSIYIRGDGMPRRSYLYAADMATWLWTLAAYGKAGAYNVGSERGLSILELASAIAKASGSQIEIAGQAENGVRPPAYLPSTQKARTELGLRESVPLEEAVERSLNWIRSTRTEKETAPRV